jgi:hypothetical protein
MVPWCGCGTAGSGVATSLVQAKGKVTYKGQPLVKGAVRFEPDGYGRMASGEIQPDGTFVLTTLTKGDGVVAGHHRVSIEAVDKSLTKDRALRKYADKNSSGLTADVTPEKTDFEFDLK